MIMHNVTFDILVYSKYHVCLFEKRLKSEEDKSQKIAAEDKSQKLAAALKAAASLAKQVSIAILLSVFPVLFICSANVFGKNVSQSFAVLT